MQKIALCIFSLLLLSSCEKDGSPVGENGESSASSVSSTSSISSSSTLSSSSSPLSSSSSSSSTAAASVSLSAMGGALSDWTNAWQQFLPEFTLSSMLKIRSAALKTTVTSPLVEREDILAMQETLDYPILFPSEDGQTVIYISPSGEPDTEVAIIKPFANLYERHLYCGTPCSFDGAVWVDNSHVVITGYSQYYPSNGEERCTETSLCTVVPTLHVFDLQNKTVTEYRGPEVNEATFMEAQLGE